MSAGALDALPSDLLTEILKLIEPKDAARLCSCFRQSVGGFSTCGPILILFIFSFSETELRSGFPLRPTNSEVPEAFFKQIYGQLEQVPGMVVRDTASLSGTSVQLHLAGPQLFGNLEISSPQCTLDRGISFQLPTLVYRLATGLHQAVAHCIEHCQNATLTTDDSWHETVVLSGGTACLPGLARRLEKGLHDLLPEATGIAVVPPPKGADSAWYGAKVISSLSTFQGSWCKTKKLSRRRSRVNFLW